MAKRDKQFSNRLNRLLMMTGKNGNQLAKEISIRQSAVWAYINEGRIPEAPILHRLSQALGVTMEHLLTGEVSKQKQPILLSKEHTAARENLDHIFQSHNRKTIEAICSNLEQFAKLVDLEPRPGEEEEKLTG